MSSAAPGGAQPDASTEASSVGAVPLSVTAPGMTSSAQPASRQPSATMRSDRRCITARGTTTNPMRSEPRRTFRAQRRAGRVRGRLGLVGARRQGRAPTAYCRAVTDPTPKEDALAWKNLATGRALGFGDPWRVPRPEGLDRGGGERIAVLLRTSERPALVVGGPGTGKSSELAQAAGLMSKDHVSCVVPLDRLVDLRSLDADMALAQMAGQLATVALSMLRMKLGAELRAELVCAGVLNPKFGDGEEPKRATTDGRELLRRTVRELRQVGRRGRVALFVDGLEKCRSDLAEGVIRALLTLREEVSIAATAPLSLVTGPDAYELLTQVSIVAQRALAVHRAAGAPWQASREFLRAVLERRLGVEVLPRSLAALSDVAAERSGGVSRPA